MSKDEQQDKAETAGSVRCRTLEVCETEDSMKMEQVSLVSRTGGYGTIQTCAPNEEFENEHSTQNTSDATASSLHFGSIVSLCFGMLTHSYLLISVFPYSGYMVIQFIESANQDNAGSYAGLLASSFNFGRMVTAYGWGKVADTYGRKTALIASLGLSCLLSMLFGLAPSFARALLVRFSIGMSNGIVGTNKTLVSDLGRGNEKDEARTMSLVLGMWAWGFFISPFVSGLLAEPVKQYPDLKLWDEHEALASLLERFPFLLPNLLGSLMCIVALLLCHFCIKETLSPSKRRDPLLFFSDAANYLKALPCRVNNRNRYRSLPVIKSHQSDVGESSGDSVTEQTNDLDEVSNEELVADNDQQEETSIWSLMKRRQTLSCLLVYWGQSFVTLAIDEMFPLFCISTRAGTYMPLVLFFNTKGKHGRLPERTRGVESYLSYPLIHFSYP